MYEWAELIKLWERDQVTEIQVIGQLLKHGEAQQARLNTLQRRLEQMEQRLPPPPGTPAADSKPTPAHR
ncbi:MAG: hypothetical protein DYG89_45480 [Caldilinea sp. CFX5]|nr:hypothetical protein [Caldilinea sp. CFX5]